MARHRRRGLARAGVKVQLQKRRFVVIYCALHHKFLLIYRQNIGARAAFADFLAEKGRDVGEDLLAYINRYRAVEKAVRLDAFLGQLVYAERRLGVIPRQKPDFDEVVQRNREVGKADVALVEHERGQLVVRERALGGGHREQDYVLYENRVGNLACVCHKNFSLLFLHLL